MVGAPNLKCGAVHIFNVGPDGEARLLSKNVLLPHLRCECSLRLVGYINIRSHVQQSWAILGVGVPKYSKTGTVFHEYGWTGGGFWWNKREFFKLLV